MIRHRRLLLLLATAGMLFSVAGVALAAAAANLYLKSDGVPAASMSYSSNPGGSLPNYDPGRDGDDGLMVKKGGDGPYEDDPTKYQQWTYQAASQTQVSVLNFTIWGAAKDFDDKDVIFEVHLFICDPSCGSPVASRSEEIEEAENWSKVTLSFNSSSRELSVGDRIVVKIIVTDESEDDMWFAYGTQQYPAALKVNASSTGSTTTSTSTTTVPATTTTQGQGTTTTRPRGPTTTTVASPPSPPTSTTSSTTTTLPGESTTTTLAAVAPGSSGPEEPSGQGGALLEPVADPSGKTPSGNDIFSPRAFDQSANLKPQVGLMAAYATVTENVTLYWQVAVALGALMTVLLIAGFEEEASEVDPGRRIQWHNRLSRI